MNALTILFSPVGRWLMVALAIGALLGLNTCTSKDRNAWKAKAGTYLQERNEAREALKLSEKRRKDDQKSAVAAISAEQGACDARVDQARRSSRTIREIVTREVPRDPQGCPVRSVVRPADGLRDALQPPGSAPGG